MSAYPNLHLQSSADVLAGHDSDELRHCKQEEVPKVSLYCEAWQAEQLMPTASPVYPLSHVQLLARVVPDLGVVAPKSQCVQRVRAGKAETFEYVPAGQSVQLWSPISSLYLPGTHATH